MTQFPQPRRRSAAGRAGLRNAARLAGRKSATSRRLDDLPAERPRAYLARLSELVGRPVEVVSVGPDREQTIFANDAHHA